MNPVQFNEVSTNDVDWKLKAAKYGEEGSAFILSNFKYSVHKDFYNHIAIQFSMESRFDPKKEQAYFWKGEK